tara:strand:+ start:243 stop:425 length:183 start_codon:yes stop_codon:yes gene_type:complete
MKKIKELYLRKYKRYSKYNLADKILNYLDYITERYGSRFIIICSIWLLVILLIDIFKRLI